MGGWVGVVAAASGARIADQQLITILQAEALHASFPAGAMGGYVRFVTAALLP
jgi:hypothetical protein